MAADGTAAATRLTEGLGAWIAALDPAAQPPSALPPSALDRAAIAMLDTIGCAVAGAAEPAVTTLARTLATAGLPATAAPTAALILGTAAHALDYDDVAFGGHVSAVIVPAILALLPTLPAPVAGPLVLGAYVAGYEVWSEVSSRETTLYHAKGGHPTGMLGPMAAAAAAAVLLRLDAVRATNALGIAASQGIGLTVNFGTMTKPFHAGRAAETGVLAALMAREGFTAAPNAIEAPNGFLPVHSPKGGIDLARPLFATPGQCRLAAAAPSVKRYPVCYAAHRAVDAALALHEAGLATLAADPATRIEITLSDRHSTTLRYRDPQTVAEARFSLEFATACALVRGRLGLAELTAATLADPAIRAVMARIARVPATEADPVLDGFAAWDQIALIGPDGGRRESPRIARPLGHADRPLTAAAAEAKARDCLAVGGLPQARIAAVIAATLGLCAPGPAAPPITVADILSAP